ncbi:MAG: DNA primase [Bacteroidetes bacterium HGW-Bacteroidetes-4]|jgi:hypothetical protein|nr:MAG: DNA primase [Bacteroidetes bacterium HGW-Bacteroidetes-4]
MTKKEFNPNDWLKDKQPNIQFETTTENTVKEVNNQKDNDIEEILQRVEAKSIDIANAYSDWRDIGFAFADEFGESGREYFHRISRFYADYSAAVCDKQYDKCLKAHGNGVTIKTFFHLAKSAGVNIKTTVSKEESDETRLYNTPPLPAEVYANLPEILKESTDLFQDNIEKDVFLVGAISVIGACLPNIEGIYFNEPHSAHLYSFITAPAGSGKSKLKWAKYFGSIIHETIVETSKKDKACFESELEHYNNLSKKERQDTERPQEPPQKMFYIPANSSSPAFIQALSDNNFCGVIFETEADTLANTFKQEWGNFSDVLRKAFHHESTNMFRRKDNEYIEIKDPHLAIALSGTPRQVHNLMPDVENGLFSRFLYYAFEDHTEFKNPFKSFRPVNYLDFFTEKGNQIFELYNQLNRLQNPISFELTEAQGDEFTKVFNEMLSRNKLLLGRDFEANVKRLGLVTFRIAMILTALRILENGDLSNPLICSDTDFNSALKLATTLEKHAIAVYQNLPNNELKGIKQKYYEALPEQFDRQTYLKVAEDMDIKPKTAEKYITQFKKSLLTHEHNSYAKVKSGK